MLCNCILPLSWCYKKMTKVICLAYNGFWTCEVVTDPFAIGLYSLLLSNVLLACHSQWRWQEWPQPKILSASPAEWNQDKAKLNDFCVSAISHLIAINGQERKHFHLLSLSSSQYSLWALGPHVYLRIPFIITIAPYPDRYIYIYFRTSTIRPPELRLLQPVLKNA